MLTGNEWLNQLYKNQINVYSDLIHCLCTGRLVDALEELERPVPIKFFRHMLESELC